VSENRPRGRPKDMDKRAAIIRAAGRLFLGRGLEAVKVEEIANAADVSKMTVYAHFVDKAALFEAVVEMQSAKIEDGLAHLYIGEGPIDAILTEFGMALMTFLMSPEIMRCENVLSSEMDRHPGLGRRFYEAGPNKIWQSLTAIIKAAVVRNELKTDDAGRAAENLIALWLGMVPLRYRFNELAPLSGAEIADRVAQGVTGFMKMCAVGR
jgi:TetR/AcrR family transcriptional regulator, mexJK operon transcriptional repressor